MTSLKYMPSDALFLLDQDLSALVGRTSDTDDNSVFFFDIDDRTMHYRFEHIEELQGEDIISHVEQEYGIGYLACNSFVHIFSNDREALGD